MYKHIIDVDTKRMYRIGGCSIYSPSILISQPNFLQQQALCLQHEYAEPLNHRWTVFYLNFLHNLDRILKLRLDDGYIWH